MALRVEGFPVVSGGMLFGVWLLPLYGSSVCPTPAGSVRCVPSRYSEAGHGAAMRGAYRRLRSWRADARCVPAHWRGSACCGCATQAPGGGSRRHRQAARSLWWATQTRKNYSQGEVASAKVVTERRCASPVSPRISAATSHAHVGASPYRGSTAHLGTPPPVDGVSIVSV